MEKLDVDELSQLMRQKICRPDASKVLDTILQSFTDLESCQTKRHKVVQSTLRALSRAKVNTSHVDNIINRIIQDLPKYSKQHLVKLVDFCIDGIREDQHKTMDEVKSWKDLLPVLLDALENEKYIRYMDTEVSGKEYRTLMVKAICNLQWRTDHLLPLAKMFGDMILIDTDEASVLKALCHALPEVPLDEIPPFVYQVLKLCRTNGSKYLMDALNKEFQSRYSHAISNEDKDSLDDIVVGTSTLTEVRDVESTVLYHVYQATQLSHQKMREFIRHVKASVYAPEYALQPFLLAVLLTISDVYEDQILAILRSTIINNAQDEKKRQSSAWLRRCLPRPHNIILIVEELIESSYKDRQLILTGLVNLAFTLMRCNESKSRLVGNTCSWEIGAEILQTVMRKRHETVVSILRELIDKIVAGGTPTKHYTDCLAYACRKLSAIVLDQQVWLTTLLDQLLFLPNPVANRVLHAIFPLMRVSPNIRENLILTLRKALYRKGTLMRRMAVTGFLEILRYSKQHSSNQNLSQRCNSSMYTISTGSSLTQVTLEHGSQHLGSSAEYAETLRYEVLDILKKCFTYEYDVRLHLYEGLYNIIKENPEITESVLDMLLPHLNAYYESDENILPPINLDLCTDTQGFEVVAYEPISMLIFLLQKIYVEAPSTKSSNFVKLQAILKSLCSRMAATNLEHLNLDHITDFLDDLPKAQQKLQNLKQAILIYEALMAFAIGEWSVKRDITDLKLDQLFEGYKRLMHFISRTPKKKTKGKGKKDITNTTLKKLSKTHNIEPLKTVMDLDVIHRGIRLVLSSSNSTPAAIQDNNEFFCYLLKTCEQLLEQTKTLVENDCWKRSDRHVNLYKDIGRLILKNLRMGLKDAFKDDEQIITSVWKCFKQICCLMCTAFSSDLSKFLTSIGLPDQTSKDINAQLEEAIFLLKFHLEALLVEVDNEVKQEFFHKTSVLLLETIDEFIRKIDFEKCDQKRIFVWIREMARSNKIGNSAAAMVLQLLINLEEYTQEYGETLNDICHELCQKIGPIYDLDSIVSIQYKVIGEDTELKVYNMINETIKQKLINASWLLNRLTSEDGTIRAGDMDLERDNLKEKERGLCKNLSYIIQMLRTVANTGIELTCGTEATFSNLQQLYHLLGRYSKYFLGKSRADTAAFQTVKFIQVVQLAGTPLKSAFYNLVTYVEENQNKTASKVESRVQRMKVLKETRIIPRVVFEIEHFSKEALLLGKRTGVPLEKYMKHSVTRDFRIKNPQLAEGLEKMNISLLVTQNSNAAENDDSLDTSINEESSHNVDEHDDDEHDDDEHEDEDDAPPSRKRARTSSESSF